MSAPSDDPNAPLAALRNDRVDRQDLLVVCTALTTAQRTLVARAGEVHDRLVAVDDRLAAIAVTERDTNDRVRSLEVGIAEFRAILIQELER